MTATGASMSPGRGSLFLISLPLTQTDAIFTSISEQLIPSIFNLYLHYFPSRHDNALKGQD